MVDPIPSISTSAVVPPSYHSLDSNSLDAKRKSEKKAEEQQIALQAYYASTIAPSETIEYKDNVIQAPSLAASKSYFQKCWDLVTGLFGVKPAEQEKLLETAPSIPISGPPKLDAPDAIDKKKLSQMIAELNEHLHRMKDMSEFEEEMRKTSSNTKSYRLDKIIINQYFAAAMRQKMSKEELGIDEQHNVLLYHQNNKKLQEHYFSLNDEINSRAKLNKVLSWINFGTTVGIVGALATGLVLGGPMAIVYGLPMLSLAKGAVSGVEGVMKYKKDLKSGELFTLQEDMSENSNQMKYKMEGMKLCDEEIAQILRTVREQLKNQSDAERIFRSASIS